MISLRAVREERYISVTILIKAISLADIDLVKYLLSMGASFGTENFSYYYRSFLRPLTSEFFHLLIENGYQLYDYKIWLGEQECIRDKHTGLSFCCETNDVGLLDEIIDIALLPKFTRAPAGEKNEIDKRIASRVFLECLLWNGAEVDTIKHLEKKMPWYLSSLPASNIEAIVGLIISRGNLPILRHLGRIMDITSGIKKAEIGYYIHNGFLSQEMFQFLMDGIQRVNYGPFNALFYPIRYLKGMLGLPIVGDTAIGGIDCALFNSPLCSVRNFEMLVERGYDPSKMGSIGSSNGESRIFYLKESMGGANNFSDEVRENQKKVIRYLESLFN